MDASQEDWLVGVPDRDRLPVIVGMIASPAFPLTAERLRALPALVVVSAYGVGYDYIDVQAASELGILVTHTPAAVTAATAELGLAMVLGLLRHLISHDRAMRQHRQADEPHPLFHRAQMAHDANSQTVGLVGYGRIGQYLAGLLKAVGFRVIYTRTHGPLAGHPGYRDLNTLLSESDIVVLVVPLTETTHHLVDCEALTRMKSTAQIVNIGRGSVIDEDALVEAIASGQIAGAALDVFEFEPRVHARLADLNSVILSPHVGTLTEETRLRMTRDALANVRQGLRGAAENALNVEAWSRRPRTLT